LLGGFFSSTITRPVTVAATVKAVEIWVSTPTPIPYNLDLVSLNYHMFEPLKEALHRLRFVSNDEVKDTMHQCPHSQLKSLFASRIWRIVNCYMSCKQGWLCWGVIHFAFVTGCLTLYN
jgi:hypothetical protein